MNSTLDQLKKQFDTPCPLVAEVRERYFSHIRTDRHLLREIKAGHIKITVTHLHRSVRTKPVIYLHHLADYLDAQATTVAA